MRTYENHYRITCPDGATIGTYANTEAAQVAAVAAENPGCTVTATYPGKAAEVRCSLHPAFAPDNCPACGSAQRRMGI